MQIHIRDITDHFCYKQWTGLLLHVRFLIYVRVSLNLFVLSKLCAFFCVNKCTPKQHFTGGGQRSGCDLLCEA